MEPKTDLLVFNRKEIGVILTLLVLVALFSFTLGIRLGKTLGTQLAATEASREVPPLTKQAASDAHPAAEEHATAPVAEHGQSDSADEHAAATPGAVSKSEASSAEDRADQEFASETAKEKVGLAKAVPMALPKDKKAVANEGGRFTLQVGSHRTVAEAAEQVTALKRQDFEAFYLEAKVKGKGTWYRVGVGTYPTKEAAEASGAKLKGEKGLPPFIVQRITD